MVLAFLLTVIVAAPLPISVPILSLLGFGAAGVGAGTIAAGIQAGIGNVAAGSAFAVAQSIAAIAAIA